MKESTAKVITTKGLLVAMLGNGDLIKADTLENLKINIIEALNKQNVRVKSIKEDNKTLRELAYTVKHFLIIQYTF